MPLPAILPGPAAFSQIFPIPKRSRRIMAGTGFICGRHGLISGMVG